MNVVAISLQRRFCCSRFAPLKNPTTVQNAKKNNNDMLSSQLIHL